MNNEICLLFNHGITQFTCKSGRPPSPPSSSSSSSSSSSGSSSTFLRARTQPSTVGTAMGPACFNYCTTTGTVTYIPALHHMQSSYIYSPSPIHRATRPTDLCVSLSGEFDRQRARMGSCRVAVVLLWVVANAVCFLPTPSSAQLRRNYYANICPNVENIVRSAVTKKVRQTFVTIPGTLRLFFHDCLVQGCDASVIIQSTANNKAEKDNPENLSLAGDGFDTVIKAKAAVDAVPQCRNKVSCADVLAMATRDVIALAGGPWYAVELGRLDGLSSTAASVTGKLPQPEFNLDQLTSMFASHGLTRADLVALSGAHTLGFAHCGRFAHRIYNFSRSGAVDPTLNRNYAAQLRGMCPRVVDPTIAINMDPVTPRSFDNQYYRNLQQGKGLFTSDQVLYSDRRSRPLVNAWARNKPAFNRAFVTAITKLGRVGVKTHSYQGNIRRDCTAFN